MSKSRSKPTVERQNGVGSKVRMAISSKEQHGLGAPEPSGARFGRAPARRPAPHRGAASNEVEKADADSRGPPEKKFVRAPALKGRSPAFASHNKFPARSVPQNS